MKIAIIGYGLLGKSISDVLKPKHEIIVVETSRLTDISSHHDADGIIICDNDNIINVVKEIPIFLPILIKCNILPDEVDHLHREFPDHSIVISPDFSKIKTSNIDFANQRYMILGGEDPECFWQDLFQEVLTQCKMVFNCSDREAAFIKYASDGFLALKTAYFNQIFDVCYSNGLEFSIIRQLLTHDNRIGTEYTMVPDPDGRRGFNDIANNMQDFISWAELSGSNFNLLHSAIDYNNQLKKNI